MLLDEPTVDIDDFERGTGWTIRPEGACRGDICVPLPAEAIHHGTVDVVAVAAAMGMAPRTRSRTLGRSAQPLVGRWAGPHQCDCARARPARPRRQRVRTVVAARPEGGPRRLGAVSRLRSRPARVAGTAHPIAPVRARDRHRWPRPPRSRGMPSLHRCGTTRSPFARRPSPSGRRAARHREHPQLRLDRRARDHRSTGRTSTCTAAIRTSNRWRSVRDPRAPSCDLG